MCAAHGRPPAREPSRPGCGRGTGTGSGERGGRTPAGARSGSWKEERRSSGGQRGPARGGGRRAEGSCGKAGAEGNAGWGSAEGVTDRAGPAPTWHRHTMSDSVASRSTTLPLPSSPHCAPSTTVTLLPPGSLRARFSPPAAGWPLRSLDARVPDMLGGWVGGWLWPQQPPPLAASLPAAAAAAEPCALPAPPPPPAFKGAANAARPAPR